MLLIYSNKIDPSGINGFAKLQQANSRVVGGPVMVVHEDEEPSGRGYNNKHNSGYGDNARTPSPLQRGKGGNVSHFHHFFGLYILKVFMSLPVNSL